MIDHAGTETKKELDELINGGTIEKQIHEDITYDDIHKSEDNLWNFLFFTGYMKKPDEKIKRQLYLRDHADSEYRNKNDLRKSDKRLVYSKSKRVRSFRVLSGST